MKRISRVRSAVAVLASVSSLGLPLGGGAAVASAAGSSVAVASVAVASTGEECPQARCSIPGLVVRGRNNGARDDRVNVRAISMAADAEAYLFRREDGELVEVASTVLNNKGNARFEVADLNGRSYTKYVAKVLATEETSRMRGAKKVR